MLKEQNDGSNISPENVDEETRGQVKIGDEEFEYVETDEDISLIVPDDYPEEKREALLRKEKDWKATIASAKKTAYDNKRASEALTEKEQELAEREQRLREKEAAAARKEQSGITENNSESRRLVNAFGVETWEEVEMLRTEDVAAYHKGLARYNADEMVALSSKAAREEGIKARISQDGHDVGRVIAFAQAQGIQNLESAYDYYKLKTAKPAGTPIAEVQKKAARIIPESKGNPGGSGKPKKVQKLNEVYSELD